MRNGFMRVIKTAKRVTKRELAQLARDIQGIPRVGCQCPKCRAARANSLGHCSGCNCWSCQYGGVSP